MVVSSLQDGPGLLGDEQVEALLQGHSVPGELVVRGEAGRVGRAGGLSRGVHFLQSVDSHPLLVLVKLQEHSD